MEETSLPSAAVCSAETLGETEKGSSFGRSAETRRGHSAKARLNWQAWEASSWHLIASLLEGRAVNAGGTTPTSAQVGYCGRREGSAAQLDGPPTELSKSLPQSCRAMQTATEGTERLGKG